MFSRCFLAASKVHARRSFRGVAQLANADGLERFGYENSPLEKMAYEAEKLFKDGSIRFDPEKYVAQRLTA
jgi:hypothetical protein